MNLERIREYFNGRNNSTALRYGNHLIDALDDLQAQMGVLVGSMQWFCSRVDKGEVRSKRTYQQYKDILSNLPESARKHREYVAELEESNNKLIGKIAKLGSEKAGVECDLIDAKEKAAKWVALEDALGPDDGAHDPSDLTPASIIAAVDKKDDLKAENTRLRGIHDKVWAALEADVAGMVESQVRSAMEAAQVDGLALNPKDETCGTCDRFDRKYTNSLTSGTCRLITKGNVRTETSYCGINSHIKKAALPPKDETCGTCKSPLCTLELRRAPSILPGAKYTCGKHGNVEKNAPHHADYDTSADAPADPPGQPGSRCKRVPIKATK